MWQTLWNGSHSNHPQHPSLPPRLVNLASKNTPFSSLWRPNSGLSGEETETSSSTRASLCSHLRADLGVSARPYLAGAANPGRCRSARSFSPPPQRGRQVRAARKPQPCLGPGPPSPPLAHPPARSSGRSRPGQAGRLLSRLTRRETEAQKHEVTNACSGTWN